MNRQMQQMCRANAVAAFCGAVLVALLSLPLAAVAANSFCGLGSVLLVPALAIGAWMALLTPDRLRRIWWLAFTVVVGLFPPFCAPVERKIFDFGRFLQAQARRGILSLPTDAIELCVLLGAILVPLVAACLAGVAAANFTQRVARRADRGTVAQSSSGARWQFSVRELLFATAALGLLLAWNARYLAGRGADERQKQRRFLARFEESFKGDEIKLLAAPIISERQGATVSGLSFKAPGQNEYRIIAPVEENGARYWAAWAYMANENDGDQELIYQYAYAQAEREEQLPQSSVLAKRYIEGTWTLVDGVPSTAGASATVIAVATPARLGKPLTVTARAPAGTICELKVYPLTEATRGLARRAPDSKGIVRWSWTPEWAGPFQYELRCIDNRASGQMVSRRRGTIPQFAVEPSGN